jgi:predicted phage-related endonuclease
MPQMIKCKNACPLGKFDGCCHKCPDFHPCPEACEENPNTCGESTFDEETGLQAFQTTQLATLNAIASLTAHKKAIEDQEKQMKAALYDAMQKYGVKKFESDVLNVTLVEPTTATSVDSTKLKKNFPDVYAQCSKTTDKAGYVKIALKGGGK